jgi:hypothetical protein
MAAPPIEQLSRCIAQTTTRALLQRFHVTKKA